MAEASPKFYRIQIVLTLVGALFLLGLCGRLLREGSSPLSIGFGVVFCLLVFLAAAMAILRLVGQRVKATRCAADARASKKSDTNTTS